MPTLLASPERFEADELRVEGEPYRHLFRARRMAVGEGLRVVDGRGRARWGRVARVERQEATVALGAPAPSCEPPLHLELFVAVFRPDRAAWLVEKVTEVGVCAVRFFHTERAPRTFGSGTLERLRRVAAAAVEQCGRALVPEVSGIHEWEELERLAAALAARWVLDTAAPATGGGSPGGTPRAPLGSAALLVGPEGGWTPAERVAARALGFTPLGLGPRTLRVETAGLVGAAHLLLPDESTA
jgi:16S rRNA (uracil1498-N3)-methyltransferase